MNVDEDADAWRAGAMTAGESKAVKVSHALPPVLLPLLLPCMPP
jgi:hypothetical protein